MVLYLGQREEFGNLQAYMYEDNPNIKSNQGVKQIKKSSIQARFVFISPPSMAILEQRLRGRGTEKEDSIQKRLAQAEKEMEFSRQEGAHDLIIVNDDLETAFAELEAFAFKGTPSATPSPATQGQGAKDAEKAGVSVQD